MLSCCLLRSSEAKLISFNLLFNYFIIYAPFRQFQAAWAMPPPRARGSGVDMEISRHQAELKCTKVAAWFITFCLNFIYLLQIVFIFKLLYNSHRYMFYNYVP